MHPTRTTTTGTTPTHTTPTMITPISDSGAGRLARLTALLRNYETARRELLRTPHGTDADNADRAARVALVSAQITGAWRLITAHTNHDLTVPDIYRHAVVIAECDARQTARFWRDTAADWRARAEHRPTSDSAGALSNWHELGVTA
jgi:hypothetical protein